LLSGGGVHFKLSPRFFSHSEGWTCTAWLRRCHGNARVCCIFSCYNLHLSPLDRENLFGNAHSHGEYLWQVSLSRHRYHVKHTLMDGQRTEKNRQTTRKRNAFLTYGIGSENTFRRSL